MKIIDSWDTRINFWEANPQLRIPALYKKLYDEDKSKTKAHSSKLMWAIALYADYTSKYRQLSEKERKIIIATDWIEDPNFDWVKIQDLIDTWNIFLPVTKKQLMEWERLMNEKTAFLKTLTYDASTAELIEKLLISNSKLYKEFEDISSRLTEDSSNSQMMGGGQESLLESGDI